MRKVEMRKCSEEMDMTVDYHANMQISPFPDMDYTSLYNKNQSTPSALRPKTPNQVLKSSRLSSRVDINAESAPLASTEHQLTKIAQDRRTQNFEQTMNVTMAFNASIYSNSLKDMLYNVINRQFQGKGEFPVNIVHPEPIQIVNNPNIAKDIELLENLTYQAQNVTEELDQKIIQLNQFINENQTLVNRRQTINLSMRINRSDVKLQQKKQLFFQNIRVDLSLTSFSLQFKNIFKLIVNAPYSTFTHENKLFNSFLEFNVQSGVEFTNYISQQIPNNYKSNKQQFPLQNEISIFKYQKEINGKQFELEEMEKQDIERLYKIMCQRLNNFQIISELIKNKPEFVTYTVVQTKPTIEIIQQEIKELQSKTVFEQNEEEHFIIMKNQHKEIRITKIFDGITTKSGDTTVNGIEGLKQLLQ
ncbi:Hypothetical_protein [Hexamita inflata]|uniref:Hypothetical_protein n=1 Tax=Hexamita inflata TaxID=28002 RepID=A0AA86PL43_9EUKA|nr:Hypothetical protein HINF_LOCUS28138 [Hexamita inflata]